MKIVINFVFLKDSSEQKLYRPTFHIKTKYREKHPYMKNITPERPYP